MDGPSVFVPGNAGLSPATVEVIAGLSAGTIATLVVHPLDIVKTRMQIHRSTTSAASTTMAILRGLVHNPAPVASLYRGLTPNLIGNATSWGSFFFFKSRIERVIAQHKGGAAPAEEAMTSPTTSSSSSSSRLSPTDYFVASGLAGIITSLITNPIWVIKTRMLASDRTSQGAYPSMWAGVCRLLGAEGVRGFYRGLGVSLLGVSHGAVQFAVYDPLKRMYFARRRRGRRKEKNPMGHGGRDDDEQMTTEATIAMSSAAKVIAGAVTYPHQVLRSRMQNYNAEEHFGRGLRNVIQRTYREEGLRGFYRGITTGVVRVLPATWVTFLVYENVKYHLPRWVG